MGLPNEPRFLVSLLPSPQEVEIVNCVRVWDDIIPIPTEKPDFDASVQEDLSELLHGSFNSDIISCIIITRSPSLIDLINMINGLIFVEIIDKSIVYWTFGNRTKI
jgi:hypothetical protein